MYLLQKYKILKVDVETHKILKQNRENYAVSMLAQIKLAVKNTDFDELLGVKE